MWYLGPVGKLSGEVTHGLALLFLPFIGKQNLLGHSYGLNYTFL